jgi:hypothetical protein
MKAGCEWPPHLRLDDEMIEYGKLHGVQPEVEFESFRDYHLAKGSKFVDWRAAYRTWIRNAEKYRNEKRAATNPSPPPRLSMQMQQAIRDNEEIAREVAGMTPEQRMQAKAKLAAILGSLK